MVSEEELLYENGEVVVSILPNQMGKIKFDLKGSLIERYAKADDQKITLQVGAKVRVTGISEELLFVEPL